MGKMSATSMLALGIAASAGGGSGTSDYTQLSNKPKINNVELTGNKTTSDLGITIPTKTSDLTNDSGFITNSYHDSTKQDTLTAGSNITISNNTISATDTTYTAGTNITIDANNVISASAEGAVKYSEAQSLTDAQKMQARANQGLPYSGYGTAYICNGDETYTTYGYISVYNDNKVEGISVGSVITVTTNATDFAFTEQVTITSIDSNNRAYITAGTEHISASNTYFDLSTGGNSYIYWNSGKGPTVSEYKPLIISYQKATNYNLLDASFISGMVISSGTGTDSVAGPGCDATQTDTVALSKGHATGYGAVAIGSSSYAAGASSVVIGNGSTAYGSQDMIYGNSNSSIYGSDAYVVGRSNSTQPSGNIYTKSGGSISSTQKYMFGNSNKSTGNYNLICGFFNDGEGQYSTTVGCGLVNPTQYTTVLGRYNVVNIYDATTTYNEGDIVYHSSYRQSFVSKVDNNVGHTPSTGSDSYWANTYDQDGDLLVIGNGTANNSRSNALVMDWSGNTTISGTVTATNIPAPPSTDGTYQLTCTVSSGVATYSWVSA